MPCENNHSAICNSTHKILYAGYVDSIGQHEYLSLRVLFLFFDHSLKKLPVTYTYDDLYSTMINIEHELVLRFEYKRFASKNFDFVFSTYTIEVDPKDMFQYLLCKGLLPLILLF